MKHFELTSEQIACVISGLLADELSWRFKKHIDFLTAASWSAQTPIGAGGVGLSSAEERAACAARVSRFFGAREELPVEESATIGRWAEVIAASVVETLDAFSFTAAGRDSIEESCEHAADEIFSDAAVVANLLYGRRRVVSLVSPHSLIGFVSTILTSNLQSAPLLDARRMAPETLSQALAFGDVVVATPSLWRYLTRERVVAPDNAMAVSFGEPLTLELAADLRKAGFGGLREIYGSTETGVVAWRDAPSEPFTLFDHWRRADEGFERRMTAGAWRAFRSMDRLEWRNERAFRLAGRRDGAVQIGAVNVFPLRIAAAIGAHPAIGACRIEVMQDESGVNRLIARLSLNQGKAPSEALARDIDAWCRAHLRPQERPRVYNFEKAL